jgi:hypothetical protein
MAVSQLSSISANLGQIMAGSITLDAEGFIKGGAASFSAGNGFWQGYDAGAYKFRVGSPVGSILAWDGANLALTIVGNNNFSIKSATSGQRFEFSSTGFRVFDANNIERIALVLT